MSSTSRSGKGTLNKFKIMNVKGATISSTQWLKRQLSDPYVQAARDDDYRSRSAFKLKQMDDKWNVLRKGMMVLDCGACPGGWSQVAVERVNAGFKPDYAETRLQKAERGTVISVDIQSIVPIKGAIIIDQADFYLDKTRQRIIKALDGTKADVILSDMAPNAMGNPMGDFLRILDLAEATFAFSLEYMKKGGTLIMKLRGGGCDKEFQMKLRKHFKSVRVVKPEACRKHSSEYFLLAKGFYSDSPVNTT